MVLVSDFVKIMLELNKTEENDLINIGAGEEHSIKDFAKIICKKTGRDFKSIQFDTSKYIGARSKCLDIKKLKKLIPNLKLTTLEAGLDKTIEWMDDQIKKGKIK